MSRLPAAVLVGAAVAACVPATVDENPRGAIGVKLRPSAATRGEPFTTTDGWTIRVTKTALMVHIGAASVEAYGTSSHGEPTTAFVPGDLEWEGVVRAIPVGQYSPAVSFAYRNFYRGVCEYCPEPEEDRSDALMRARFARPADGAAIEHCLGGVPDADCSLPGPSFWIVLTATRGARTVTLDLAFDPQSFFSERSAGPLLQIKRNDIVGAEVVVAVERLFAGRDGELVFDDLAEADTNLDGVLSPVELRAADQAPGEEDEEDEEAPEPPDDLDGFDIDYEVYQSTLLDVLRARAAAIFVRP